jgi:hypothetical protein
MSIFRRYNLNNLLLYAYMYSFHVQYNNVSWLILKVCPSSVLYPLYGVNTSLLPAHELCNRIRTRFDVFSSTVRA